MFACAGTTTEANAVEQTQEWYQRLHFACKHASVLQLLRLLNMCYSLPCLENLDIRHRAFCSEMLLEARFVHVLGYVFYAQTRAGSLLITGCLQRLGQGRGIVAHWQLTLGSSAAAAYSRARCSCHYAARKKVTLF